MNIDSQVDIGNRIKAIRQSRGENQTEFAKKIKATLPAVSNWETGRNIPNNKRLKAIADIGGITVDELLYGDNASIKIEVGNRINQIRLSKGDTLEEFGIRIARVLNVSSNKAPSKSNVSKWEAGSSLPNKARLKAIADIGDMSVDELLGKDTVTISKDEYNELLEIAQKYEKSNSNSIGQRIKNIRLELGDTLEEFGLRIARVLNIQSSKAPIKGNISRWEQGFSLPNKERLKAIADIGGMTVDELLYGGKTISNSELELIKKLPKENKQLKDDIKELKIKNNELENKNTELRIELQKEKKNLKNIVETIKSIDLSDR